MYQQVKSYFFRCDAILIHRAKTIDQGIEVNHLREVLTSIVVISTATTTTTAASPIALLFVPRWASSHFALGTRRFANQMRTTSGILAKRLRSGNGSYGALAISIVYLGALR